MEKHRTACAPDQALPHNGRQFIIGCLSLTIADHRVQQETRRRLVGSIDSLKERKGHESWRALLTTKAHQEGMLKQQSLDHALIKRQMLHRCGRMSDHAEAWIRKGWRGPERTRFTHAAHHIPDVLDQLPAPRMTQAIAEKAPRILGKKRQRRYQIRQDLDQQIDVFGRAARKHRIKIIRRPGEDGDYLAAEGLMFKQALNPQAVFRTRPSAPARQMPVRLRFKGLMPAPLKQIAELSRYAQVSGVSNRQTG